MLSPATDLDHHPAILDLDRPSPARVDNALLGGGYNFAADRQAATALLARDPGLARRLRNHQSAILRVTGYAVDAGIRQFIYLRCGIPFPCGIHTVLQRRCSAGRVVYVDDDPVVVELIRNVLGQDPSVSAVEAESDDLDSIRNHEWICGLIDPDQPAMVLSSRGREAAMEAPTCDLTATVHHPTAETTLRLTLMSHQIILSGDSSRWAESVRTVFVPPCSVAPAPLTGRTQQDADAAWSIRVSRARNNPLADDAGRPQVSWPASGTRLAVLDATNGLLRLAGQYREDMSWVRISTDHLRRSTDLEIPDDEPVNARWPGWLVRMHLGTQLLSDGWTLLHAAAVRFPTQDGDRALLILAESSGGKSTLAHRACTERCAHLLADDLVLVKAVDGGVIVIGWPTRICVPLDLLSEAHLHHLPTHPVVGSTADGYARRRMVLGPGEYAERFGIRRAGPTRLGAVLVVRSSTQVASEPNVRNPLEPAEIDAAVNRSRQVPSQRLMMLDLLGVAGPAATFSHGQDANPPPEVTLSARALSGVVTMGLDLPTAAVLPRLPVWDLLAPAWPPVTGEPQ